MNQRMKWAVLSLFMGIGWAAAEVSVSFPVTDVGLRHLRTLTLDFTVDGTGHVTMDAQSSNGGAEPQAVVDAWDGPVGMVDNVALYGTAFSLVGVAKDNGVQVEQLSTDADESGQGLIVNGARIDHAGTEEIIWTYTGEDSTRLSFKAIAYTSRAANGDSNLTFLDHDTRAEYMLPKTSTGGSVNLVGGGFILENGQAFIITTDDLNSEGGVRAASAGASLYGFTFKVISESKSIGLLTS